MAVEKIVEGADASDPARVVFTVSQRAAGSHDPLEATVYDIAGRRIRTLQTSVSSGGRFTSTWDYSRGPGERVEAGM